MSDYKSVAPLQNVTAMLQLVEHVKDRTIGLPGLGVYYGPAGWGKSTATINAANEFRAYHVQMASLWTKKTLCEKIAEDMGLIPAKTTARILDQITEVLARTGRPLLIDEADYLVDGNMVNVVRDIYEGSEAAIILIGEERLPKKLERWERFHSRILDWVAAQPGTLVELNQLADIYCTGIELDDALKGHIQAISSGSLRYICTNLDAIKIYARAYNKNAVAYAELDEEFFYTGVSPKARVF